MSKVLEDEKDPDQGKDPAAVAPGRGGGVARGAALRKRRKTETARAAAKKR